MIFASIRKLKNMPPAYRRAGGMFLFYPERVIALLAGWFIFDWLFASAFFGKHQLRSLETVIPVCLFALVMASALAGRFRTLRLQDQVRKHEGRICPQCGYPLAHASDKMTCPECGLTQNIQTTQRQWADAFAHAGS